MKKNYVIVVLLLCGIASAQTIAFTNQAFKNKLLTSSASNYVAYSTSNQYFDIDANNDNEIQVSEALMVRRLTLSFANITDLSEISFFTNLQELYCHFNNIDALDVTMLPNLRYLACYENNMSTLVVNNMPQLRELNAYKNDLTSLNLQGLPELDILNIHQNQLAAIDLSQTPSLRNLYLDQNLITSIDLTSVPILALLSIGDNLLTELNIPILPELTYIYCARNALSTLDLSNVPTVTILGVDENMLTSLDLGEISELQSIWVNDNLLTELDLSNIVVQDIRCQNNNIAELDLSKSTYLNELRCQNNPALTMVNVKAGMLQEIQGIVTFFPNPNLTYICADPINIPQIQNIVDDANADYCNVGWYCSLAPGGEYHTVTGAAKWDMYNNGCSETDPNFQFFSLTVTDGTFTGTYISDSDGNFSIPLGPGSYTLTPSFQLPQFFSSAMQQLIVPSGYGNIETDFCVVSPSDYNDLEVVVVPIGAARPGFDARYKVTYRNKGINTMDGTVQLAFEDSHMDFVSAIPPVSSIQPSVLTWNYVGLMPQEVREISVKLNMNGPTETPPLNTGDDIGFNAIINPITGDSLYEDNQHGLKQYLMNSQDPNDKTCVQGQFVGTEIIGGYADYVIRFENVGSFYAENVIIKDFIDLAKFEIGTLTPLSGSHPFRTVVSGNHVEFIFEGINLDFQDGLNDGYVAFRIKVRNTLEIGDSFANAASIYFDYNFPIDTNTAVTEIQQLSVESFQNIQISVFPNPVADKLSVKIPDGLFLTKVTILNSVGSEVKSFLPFLATAGIDVGALASGQYFLKLESPEGIHVRKFVKQ